MDIHNKSAKELYDLAYNTSDVGILTILSDHHDSTVRRIVARNQKTEQKTLNRLARDPVLNVSYMATLHPRCTIKREYEDLSNPCISCTKDERSMICTGCGTLQKYYNIF